MRRIAILVRAAILRAAFVVLRHVPRQPTLAGLIAEKGLPAFTADSLAFSKGLLRVKRLQPIDPAAPLRLKVRDLIYCGPWEALRLDAANTAGRFQWVTPIIEDGGKGIRIAPSRMLLVFSDGRGMILGAQEVLATEVAVERPARP